MARMRTSRELLEGRTTKTFVAVRERAQSTFLGWLFWLFSMLSLLLAGALYWIARPAAGRVPLDSKLLTVKDGRS
jgi:hypothetical protein